MGAFTVFTVQYYFSHYVQYIYKFKKLSIKIKLYFKNKLYKDDKKIRKVKKHC
jgi:hypothetical protein